MEDTNPKTNILVAPELLPGPKKKWIIFQPSIVQDQKMKKDFRVAFPGKIKRYTPMINIYKLAPIFYQTDLAPFNFNQRFKIRKLDAGDAYI